MVSTKTCDAVKNFKPLRSVTDVRSFLGLCNVFRRFIPNFARVAAPLTAKLEKDHPQRFPSLSPTEENAFESLKQLLISPPVLALPRADGHYTLDTDACDVQVGCVLIQDQRDGPPRSIGYWSRKLTKPEQNYSTTEKECLAVVWAILLLRPYLECVHFTVRTDHSALRWILSLTESTGRLARWRLRLLQYDFDITHRAGIKHQAPDALSRLPTTASDESPVLNDLPLLCVDASLVVEDPAIDDLADRPHWSKIPALPVVSASKFSETPVTTDEILDAQKTDPWCRQLAETVGSQGSQFAFNSYGLLVRLSRLDGALQVVVPPCLRARILYLGHDTALSGHPGSRRMYDTLRRTFYWPLLASDVADTVRQCISCARTRGTYYSHQKYLRLFPANGPLEFLALDLLGPLPTSRRGNKHVLIITDRYSKLTRAVALNSTTAPQVAEAFLDAWIMPYDIQRHSE